MQHIENLLRPWSTVLPNTKELPAVITVVVKHGGTRPAWCTKNSKKETMLLAWPQESLMRASIIISGDVEGKLDPYSVIPLLEGIPNEMRVEKTQVWKNGIEGEVACAMGDSEQLLWFYDPLFFRDAEADLTEGVTQTFYISALCLGIRPALLDELTITQGPDYEAYLAAWLQENPDKTRLDVPPLRIPLKGQRILAPTDTASEYQARAIVREVETLNFGPEQAPTKMYRFGVTFGQEKFLHIMVYASEKVCLKGYVPQVGDEVDMLFWMQGRVVDVDPEVEATALAEMQAQMQSEALNNTHINTHINPLDHLAEQKESGYAQDTPKDMTTKETTTRDMTGDMLGDSAKNKVKEKQDKAIKSSVKTSKDTEKSSSKQKEKSKDTKATKSKK